MCYEEIKCVKALPSSPRALRNRSSQISQDHSWATPAFPFTCFEKLRLRSRLSHRPNQCDADSLPAVCEVTQWEGPEQEDPPVRLEQESERITGRLLRGAAPWLSEARRRLWCEGHNGRHFKSEEGQQAIQLKESHKQCHVSRITPESL